MFLITCSKIPKNLQKLTFLKSNLYNTRDIRGKLLVYNNLLKTNVGR